MTTGETVTASFVLRRIIIIVFIAITLVLEVPAQLCNGSLGDPVVNISFSQNNGNTGYAPTNAYTYTSITCPNDGYYTITGATSGCFGNAWHTVTKDHTGDGAFMLINASYEPGDFFLTTVTDLCPNTNYQFAAWIMNVLNRSGIRPNITFNIETKAGTLLGQYATGDIPETPHPTWKQYGLYFTTPPGNAEIVLRITNNAPGGSGNDLALDDITFSPCGPLITAAIENNADTADICEGNTNVYTFTGYVAPGFSMPVYQWQVSTNKGVSWQNIPGANALSYLRTPTSTGSYWYRLAVIEQVSINIISCLVASNTVVINMHANPLVNAGPDRISIAGEPVTLQGSVTGEAPVYNWNPPAYLSNDSVLTPEASPPADISYRLLATSAYGCKSNDEVAVKAVAGIFVPNAFTPNNDGKNDSWHIPYLDPLFGAVVNVYNRYGQLVYHTEGKTVDWNGTFNGLPQSTGTYIYVIQFKSGYPDMKGTILLMR